MTWFVSDSPLARPGEPQDPGLIIGAFSEEGKARLFAQKQRAASGSSLTYVERRRGGRTVRKIGPDQVDAWLNEGD